ncbi:MAG: hypothetical protein IT353_00905 [Gemmatimonadaceae bacterium]|nr:hypothetical protein [Gemmatimonadaceae bacterium]
MTTANAGKRSVGRSVLFFSVAQGGLIAVAALVLSRVVWTDEASAHAISISALVAMVVQIMTFVIARLVAREHVIAGWGVGVVLRFAVVAVWAFLGIKALGLLPSPALFSLVIFFFVATLVEPIFLNA